MKTTQNHRVLITEPHVAQGSLLPYNMSPMPFKVTVPPLDRGLVRATHAGQKRTASEERFIP